MFRWQPRNLRKWTRNPISFFTFPSPLFRADLFRRRRHYSLIRNRHLLLLLLLLLLPRIHQKLRETAETAAAVLSFAFHISWRRFREPLFAPHMKVFPMAGRGGELGGSTKRLGWWLDTGGGGEREGLFFSPSRKGEGGSFQGRPLFPPLSILWELERGRKRRKGGGRGNLRAFWRRGRCVCVCWISCSKEGASTFSSFGNWSTLCR